MTDANKAVTFPCNENKNILVCGASSFSLAPLGALLKAEACSRLTFLSEPEQIAGVLKKDCFDLLLLEVDSAQPKLLELIHELRLSYTNTRLPVLIIIDASLNEFRNQLLQAGANDALFLPVDPVEMSHRVKNLLLMNAMHKAHQHTVNNFEREVKLRSTKLDMLIESGLMMSSERDRSALFKHILLEGQRLLHCDGGTMYLVTGDNTLRFAVRTKDDQLPSSELPLYDAVGEPNEKYASTYVALHNQSVLIDDVYQETDFDLSGTRSFDEKSHYRTVSMLTVPMAARNGEVIGVLQFFNALEHDTGRIIPFSRDLVRLVESLGAQAAVSLDNMQLMEEQKVVMESMVRVIATAIDAKSPYTGRHCERVPELALMLAAEACKAGKGSLAKFNFQSDEEWQEFRIGAWLHDCGKVTTPEYVINKATKLDTIYNRIHEIRTRFEVLLRDAEIERLEALLKGGDSREANQRFASQKQELEEDFAFIAGCNRGSEIMDPAHIGRIREIAQKTWLRHFDDRLGLSQEERVRVQFEPVAPLPAQECLLADKLRHVIPRMSGEAPDPSFGFKMKIPKDLYNYGEIYNLSVNRGTLTEEERYKINEHIIHTIMMLERMPFPKSLQRVPEYASTHHETLNGTGYPRCLTADELSIPSRIMAIADIFEALTATDRPYRSPNKLSEAIPILYKMKCKEQIDADLFDLFLSSGVYLRYAEKFLNPEQIDAVDIRAYISEPWDLKNEPCLNLSRPPFKRIAKQSVEEASRDIVKAFVIVEEKPDKVSVVFNAIMGCLELNEKNPLLMVGRQLAAVIDADGKHHNNAYHNKQHFCEVMMGAYYLSLFKELGVLATAELIVAAMIHDFHHDGKLNGAIPFRLERLAVEEVRPYLKEAGILHAQQRRLAALVLATDLAYGVDIAHACYAHHSDGRHLLDIPDAAPELAELASDPEAAVQALILCEADVLPSIGLTAEHAMVLQNNLSKEWGILLGPKDKLRFIDYGFRGFIVGKFFSSNVDNLKQAALSYLDTKHHEI